MTHHEYIFVAISIILGLAITRLLHTVGILIRAHRQVEFHWSTALWGICVLTYSLQFWWVGWGLRHLQDWDFINFVILAAGAICLYGAAEMALPVPEGHRAPNFLEHSQGLGRLSALSMILYFAVGPYVNIALFNNDVTASLALPALGAALMILIMMLPQIFPVLSVLFALYTGVILALTA